MKKKVIQEIIINILLGKVDGKEKEIDGWHIDDIDKSLIKNKKNWYEKSLSFYPFVYVLMRQLHMPWNIFLVIYLTDCRKKENRGLNASTLNELKMSISRTTPPEFFICSNKLSNFYTDTPLIANNYKFIDLNTYVYFFEKYDKHSNVHIRNLNIFIKENYIFRLMVAKLFKGYNLSLNDSNYINYNDESRIKELEILLKKDPRNINFLMELGILLFISFNNPNQAKEYLLKIISLNPRNIDAYFWLAQCLYYYFNDSLHAKKLIDCALSINSKRADCLSFNFHLTWKLLKSPYQAINYLKQAIHYAPDWILPRIQYFNFLIINNEFDLAKQEIEKLNNLVKEYPIEENTINKFYATYVTGNVIENNLVIKNLFYILKKISY